MRQEEPKRDETPSKGSNGEHSGESLRFRTKKTAAPRTKRDAAATTRADLLQATQEPDADQRDNDRDDTGLDERPRGVGVVETGRHFRIGGAHSKSQGRGCDGSAEGQREELNFIHGGGAATLR